MNNVTGFVPDVALAHLLSTEFCGGAQVAAWYLGLIVHVFQGQTPILTNPVAPVFDTSDTMASHPGWGEITPYAGNRPAWGPAIIGSGTISNLGGTLFAIDSPAAVWGVLICSEASGNAPTNVLLCEAGFADFFDLDSFAVISGDTLSVVLTLQIRQRFA